MASRKGAARGGPQSINHDGKQEGRGSWRTAINQSIMAIKQPSRHRLVTQSRNRLETVSKPSRNRFAC